MDEYWATRTGRWQRAMRVQVRFEVALLKARLAAAEVPEFVRGMLEFERTLVRARDVACHTVGEVEAEASDSGESRGTVH
jgi:hypothetical protein